MCKSYAYIHGKNIFTILKHTSFRDSSSAVKGNAIRNDMSCQSTVPCCACAVVTLKYLYCLCLSASEALMFGRHCHDGGSDRRLRESCELLLAAAVAARDVHLDAADDEQNGGGLRADAVAHVALLHHCVALEHEEEAAAEHCRSGEASYCNTAITN